jgi:prepilin-type N-terminal cleavage/methylation domain-containing protein
VDRSSDGFTLTELLVAITILGIIMVVIGAMITTAFRTSTTVSAELQGSRGPKVVSRYWVPDVEQAETVDQVAPCGGGTAIVTFGSPILVSAFDHPDQATTATTRTISWSTEPQGARTQLVRYECEGTGAAQRLVVVSDLTTTAANPAVSTNGTRATITVTVPDRSRTNKVYTFDVTGMAQSTTVTT